MRMATKPHAFRTTTDAHPVAHAQESETNTHWTSTTHDDHLPRIQPLRVRIGEFEVDLRTGELRAGASTVRLQEQPFRILRMLLGHDGEIVTRDQIQEMLWADGTIVDFGHSINSAIKKLRRAFGDSADHARYIETLPRRGYRLMFPVQWSYRGQSARPPGCDSPLPQPVGHFAESRIAKHRRQQVFDGGTLSVAVMSPCASQQAVHQPQEKVGQSSATVAQRRELEDRLFCLERLVLARVRHLRRQQRCLFRLRTSPRGGRVVSFSAYRKNKI